MLCLDVSIERRTLEGEIIMSPEFKVVWWTFVVIIVVGNIIRYGIKWNKKWHWFRHGEEDMALNAISGHSCFESKKKYPFDSGRRTPLEEFYRRYNNRLKGSGRMNQRVANRIAYDVASQVRSFRSARKDQDDTLLF